MLKILTHITKKQIIATALVAVTLSATSIGAYSLFGKQGGSETNAPPQQSENVAYLKPTDKTIDECSPILNLFIAQGELQRAGSFRGVSNGVTVSMGIKQSIYAERYVSGDSVYKKSVSKSTFVQMADERLADRGRYAWRETKDVKSLTEVIWGGNPVNRTEDAFLNRYGSIGSTLSSYILNEETVLNGELVSKENGIYTYAYDLDVDAAPYYLKYEMKTNAGSPTYATFMKSRIIVAMDEEWVVKTLTTDCVYLVDVKGLKGTKCTESMTEEFFDIGNCGEVENFPEYDLFNACFDKEIESVGDEEKEVEPIDVLTGMFADYIGGDKLNAAIRVTDCDGNELDADLSLKLDIENTENIACDLVLFGDEVGHEIKISYAKGKLAFSIGEFIAGLNLNSLSVLSGAEDFDISLSDILSAMILTENENSITVTLPIKLGNFELSAMINGEKTEDGYIFIGATIDVADYSVTVVPMVGNIAGLDVGSAPDIKNLIFELTNKPTVLSVGAGDFAFDATVDPQNKTVNAAFGEDITVTMTLEDVYFDLGGYKFVTELKPLIVELTQRLGVLTEFEMPAPIEIVGLLSQLNTETVDGITFINAKFGSLSACIGLGKNENGELKLEALNVAIADSFTVSLSDSAPVQTIDLTAEYRRFDAAELVGDLLPEISSVLKCEKSLSIQLRILDGAEINAYLGLSLQEKEIRLLIPEFFGAELNLKIGSNKALLAYGNITAGLYYEDINDLIGQIKEIIGEIDDSLTSGFEGIEIDLDDVFDMVGSIEKITTEDGYELVIGKRGEIKITVKSGKLESVKVETEKLSVVLKSVESVTFGDIDESKAIDAKELVKTVVPEIKKIINSDAYLLAIDGIELFAGANKYVLKGNVGINKTGEVLITAELYYGNSGLIKCEIDYVKNKLYGTVNGYAFAFEMSNTSIDVDSLSGKNEYLDELLKTIDKLKGIDFKTIEYGKLISECSLKNGKLNIKADCTAIGFSGVILDGTIGDGLTLSVDGLKLKDLKLNGNFGIKSSEVIVNGEEKESTDITLKVDEYEIAVSVDLNKREINARTEINGRELKIAYAKEELKVKFGDGVICGSIEEIKKFCEELGFNLSIGEVGDALEILKAVRLEDVDGKTEIKLDIGEISLKLFVGENFETEISVVFGSKKIVANVGSEKVSGISEEAIASVGELTPVVKELINAVKLGGTFEITLNGQTEILGLNEIKAYAQICDTDKTVKVLVKDLFGSNLNVKIGSKKALLAYGNITAGLYYEDIDDLIGLIKEIIGEIDDSLTSGFDGIEIDLDDVFDMVGSIEKITTEDGYELVIGKRGEIKITVKSGKLESVKVETEKLSVILKTVERVTFGDIDESKAIDLKELVKTVVPEIKKLINADGYAFAADCVSLKINNTAIDVKNISLEIKKVADVYRVKLNCELFLNGKPLAKVYAVYKDGVLCCELNGYKFAIKTDALGGKQLSLDMFGDGITSELKTLIEELKSLDIASAIKAIKTLSYNGDTLVASIALDGIFDGEIPVEAVFGDKIIISVGKVAFGKNTKFSVGIESLSVGSFVDNVTLPDVDDYITEFAIEIDDKNTLYAKLDLYREIYEFDLAGASGTDEEKTVGHLYAKYDCGVVKIKCGNAFVRCDIEKMTEIIEKLYAMAHPESVESSFSKSSDAKSIIDEVLANFSLSQDGGKTDLSTAISDALKNMLTIELTVSVGNNYKTEAYADVSGVNRTLKILSKVNPSAYETFDDGEKYVDIADVFDDYFDTLVKLTDVKGGKSWTFDLSGVDLTFNGVNYKVYGEGIGLYYSEDEMTLSADKLSITSIEGDVSTLKEYSLYLAYKKQYADENKTVVDKTASRVYVTFNDLCNASSKLSLSCSVEALDKCVNELLPQLFEVVPQLKELLSGKIGLGDAINLSSMISDVNYDKSNSNKLSLTLNLGVLISGAGSTVFNFTMPENGKVALNVGSVTASGEGFGMVINGTSLSVAADEVATPYAYPYDETHINLDSVDSLLRSFIKTANRTSFRLTGEVPVKLVALGFINADVVLDVDVRIDVVKNKGGSDTVYIAAKISRKDLSSVAEIAFKDKGGDSYLFYDGAANTVTVKRNSINSYTYCSQTGGYGCGNIFHFGKHKTVKLSDVEYSGNCSYDTTVSAERFSADFLDYFLEMINMIDMINDEIIKAVEEGGDSPYGIDDIIKTYDYSSPVYTVNTTLKPIDSVLGDLNLNVYHDEEYNLSKLTGDVKLLDISGVSCDGKFEIRLVDSAFGDATSLTTNQTLF